uniref:Uncharacterized protein n=1 Tax=Onchocerca volvulus TaxID=6282 RepID=A0A8R1XZ62_ONCVO
MFPHMFCILMSHNTLNTRSGQSHGFRMQLHSLLLHCKQLQIPCQYLEEVGERQIIDSYCTQNPELFLEDGWEYSKYASYCVVLMTVYLNKHYQFCIESYEGVRLEVLDREYHNYLRSEGTSVIQQMVVYAKLWEFSPRRLSKSYWMSA